MRREEVPFLRAKAWSPDSRQLVTGDQAQDAQHCTTHLWLFQFITRPLALTKVGRARLWQMRDEDKSVQANCRFGGMPCAEFYSTKLRALRTCSTDDIPPPRRDAVSKLFGGRLSMHAATRQKCLSGSRCPHHRA